MELRQDPVKVVLDSQIEWIWVRVGISRVEGVVVLLQLLKVVLFFGFLLELLNF